MKDLGKRSVLGTLVDAIDYDAAVERVASAAHEGRPFAATALAVHGVMEAHADPSFRYILNDLDLVTPDGQPVRWALNMLYRTGLQEQVRGTNLTLRILARATADRLPVYFHGSRPDVLDRVLATVHRHFPALTVAGSTPSAFREVPREELARLGASIVRTGAHVALVGLGCPRQEIFVHELRSLLPIPLIAVGAAFDYLAGTLRMPPQRVQSLGLEWLWRLGLEPRRLWRRYLILNPLYVSMVALQAARLHDPDTRGVDPGTLERVAV